MKHLKTYQIFESQERKELTEEQKEFLNKYTDGTWSYDPATGLVDIKGDFDCRYSKLNSLLGIRFGKVTGSFMCSENKLTSLKGAPQEVGGNFSCSYNPIDSLVGAPQKVGGFFRCEANELTSLEGGPQTVGDSFTCGYNSLTTLHGGPQKVGNDYNCIKNNLKSLEGAPKKVGGTFYCFRNPLTSLNGAPEEVVGGFVCDGFNLGRGEWNRNTWLRIFDKGSAVDKQLVLPLLSAKEINRRIPQDPAGMIMMLKGVWNSEKFKEIRSELVWPEGYEKEMNLAGDMGNLGF